MAGSKVLVLGGTGPTGICLLRELVYRKHETIVYARNPSKIDENLAANECLEIIKGEMDNLELLSDAIARSRIVISLLGPKVFDKIPTTMYADIYRKSVFPLMREHGVRRILAMGTPSIPRPEDSWTFLSCFGIPLLRIFASPAYQNVRNIGDAFDHHAEGLDWTVYRISAIPGNDDEESWRIDREDGEVFVGWVGQRGWTMSQKRGSLARWLVDAAEGGAEKWLFFSLSSESRELTKMVTKKEPNTTANPSTAPVDDVEPVDPELLDEELGLVSSLAKLQKLEEMIHQLRTLLPDRILEPMIPIVNPKAAQNGINVAPQKLVEQLSQAARSGSNEVAEFKAMWRGKEMKSVWERIETLTYENAGQLLQSNGMWEYDYNEILEDLTKQDNARKEKEQKAKEEQERSQLQSAEGGWRALVDQYTHATLDGMRVLPTKQQSSFVIMLQKAGLAFKVSAVSTGQEGVPNFTVSTKSPSGEPTSKLETAVLDCLNSRPRKWDLAYLIEMTKSYSNLSQAPCIKCGKMQDNAANLPTIRREKPTTPQADPQQPTFDAYHATCV
ncbi:RNA polymerase II mediator complex subunit MED27 domain-containing protein [Aspergillus stella-maris]|uniref:RNA polymerase II mediator complex subunit MED27 domain-containing protein n=1 Tax=Aspergillus stella-maris TaxID=1810926 RepID=UPI003CCD5A3E